MVGASLARGTWRVSAALVLVCVSWSGVARAADVSVAVKRALGVHDARLVNVRLLYRAGAGESSNLTVSFTGHRFTLSDSAADLRALTRCEQGDLHTVTCDEPGETTLRMIDVTLGGGDDRFSFGHVDAGSQLDGRVVAGGGNDRIDASGASGDLSIDGGQGRNSLVGGPGDDRFYVGPGNNTIDGGAGENVVDFGKSVGPVHASVKDGAARAPGEADTFQRVQDLFGSRYDDVLIGDDGPNFIVGAEGDDTILGVGGNDQLDGFGAPARVGSKPSAYEHNLVFGGAGDDDMLATCKGADALVGGPGTNSYGLGFSGACVKRPSQGQLTKVFCSSTRDRVSQPNWFDLLIGCRHVESPFADFRPDGRIPPSGLTPNWGASYLIPCPFEERPCLDRLTLTTPRREGHAVVLGARTLRLPRGGSRTIRTGLTQRGRAYLRRHPRTLVDVALYTSSFDFPYGLGSEYLVPLRHIPPPAEP